MTPTPAQNLLAELPHIIITATLGDQGKLEPINTNTVRLKLEAARRALPAVHTFVVAQGQQGLTESPEWHAGSGAALRVVEVAHVDDITTLATNAQQLRQQSRRALVDQSVVFERFPPNHWPPMALAAGCSVSFES